MPNRPFTDPDDHETAACGAARVLRLEANRTLVEAIALYRSTGFTEIPAFNGEPYARQASTGSEGRGGRTPDPLRRQAAVGVDAPAAGRSRTRSRSARTRPAAATA